MRPFRLALLLRVKTRHNLMSINRTGEKQIVVYTYNRMVYNSENELTVTTHINMSDSQNHTMLSKKCD